MSQERFDRRDTRIHASAVEQYVNRRTFGRIHQLRVEVEGERLVVKGRAASYYVKQLALQAALEAIDSVDAQVVDLDIQVRSSQLPAHASVSSEMPVLQS